MKAYNIEKTNLFKRFQRSANRQHCPMCGALMVMLHSGRENGALFVWYSCPKGSCRGQWLKQIGPHSSNRFRKVG